MKKFTSLLAAALMLAAPAWADDYAVNYEEGAVSSYSGRYPAAVTVTSAEYGVQEVTWASADKHLLYTDATDQEVTVTTGEEISLAVNYSGGWMNAYVYVDLNGDGIFGTEVDEENHCAAEGSELVSWSAYSFAPESSEDPMWNAEGTQLTGSARNTWIPTPFTLNAEGTYRIRVKIDWNSIDPGGSVTGHLGGAMQANGGGIIDFTIHVVAPFEPVTMRFHNSTGSWTASNAAGTWASAFATTETDPGFTITQTWNNMAWDANGDPKLYIGTQQGGAWPTPQININATDGYKVVGYTFKASPVTSGQTFTVTLADGTTYNVASETEITATDLDKQSTYFTLASDGNNGLLCADFYVTLDKAQTTETKTVPFVYDGSAGHNVVYRIPSIASDPNTGRIIAITDYRPGGSDVGGGEVDLHCKYSDDFGATWSDEIVIVNGTWGDSRGGRWYSFGDPVSIVDRESSKVMVVSCSGNVMYPSATRTNHQGVETYFSTDGGETWTEPVDVSEQIYGQLDSRSAGAIASLFVGSGGFTQSKFVKKGDYYRVYGAILCRNSSTGGIGYIIYTDDFGKTWTVLGGADAPGIPSGGDEMKAEELPDGSVLISSRLTGGRLFNIWRWNDNTFTEGAWDTYATSNSSNNGVVAVGNACNGEILIVPAVRNEDGKCVYLAMQSIPFGSGRANVGIYYKELESIADWSTPADFAKDWDGHYQVSYLSSAYSAMVLQEDHNIGFLVEESTYSGLSYSQVYHNLSFETITDGAYSYKSDTDADFDKSPFSAERYSFSYELQWNGETKQTVQVSGYAGADYPAPALPAFVEATGMPEGTISAEDQGQTYVIECTEAADAPIHFAETPQEALYTFLKIKDTYYINDLGAQSITLDGATSVNLTQAASAWAFVGNPFDGFRLYNSNGKILTTTSPVGDGNTGGATYPYTEDPNQVAAGRTQEWVLSTSSYYTDGFFCGIKGESSSILNYRSPYLAYWTSGADAGSTLTAYRAVQTKTLTVKPEEDTFRYCTAAYPYDVQLPETATAYILTIDEENGTLVPTEIVGAVPAFTPVLIKSEGTSAAVTLAESVPVEVDLVNSLTAAYTSQSLAADGVTYYTVAKDENGALAFVPATTTGANTAYLAVETESPRAEYLVDFNGVVNGIRTAGAEEGTSAKYFDLSGRRVEQSAAHGVLITSQGRKVVVK